MRNPTESNSVDKEEARRRGLRVAAKLAAAGVIAAACAAGAWSAMADETPSATAEQVKDLVKVRAQSGGCGCAPCWGPPAPPAMPDASTNEVARDA